MRRQGGFWKNVLAGLLMGIGCVLPGVSGGVMAVSFGLYRPMLDAVLGIFHDTRRKLVFLAPLALGGAAGLLLGARGLGAAMRLYEKPMLCLFTGFILGGVPDLLAEAEERNLFEEGAFDACYAWRMHHLMNDVARQRTRVTALRDYIYADRDDYPDSAMRLAFTSNHDENSWNGSEFSRLGDAREIMAVFTFVVPRGLPLIYTGQEIGYDHSFAFFDRDPIPRYEANAFTGFYRRLTALRHDGHAREVLGAVARAVHQPRRGGPLPAGAGAGGQRAAAGRQALRGAVRLCAPQL